MQKIVSHQNVEECSGWLLIRMAPTCGARWIAASISVELNRFILINCAESIQVCASANFLSPATLTFSSVHIAREEKKKKEKKLFFPTLINISVSDCDIDKEQWSKDGMLSVYCSCTDCILHRLPARCCQRSCSNFCSVACCATPPLPSSFIHYSVCFCRVFFMFSTGNTQYLMWSKESISPAWTPKQTKRKLYPNHIHGK